MRTIKAKILIKFPTKSTKTLESIQALIMRGVIRGLDTEPNYIANPREVDIRIIEIVENEKEILKDCSA